MLCLAQLNYRRLIYSASINVAADVEQGTLEPLLERFSPAQESFFIYYPRASRNQPKLRAFVDLCTRIGGR